MHPEERKDVDVTNSVFIDGSAGTTGLRIADRLASRDDLEIITIPDEFRKDAGVRAEAMNSADVVFFCLPDAAAREAATFVTNDRTVVIDTSTAHRTNPAWAYGFPELHGQREKIAASTRIANPGCHATGFIALVAPLVAAGVVSADAALSSFSLTGYSGGGKAMIAEYENPDNELALEAPRVYGLTQTHKHLPEMQKFSGLHAAPIFSPIVSSYLAGLEVVVPVFASDLDIPAGSKPAAAITDIYREYYTTGVVHTVAEMDEAGFVSAGGGADRDDLELAVFGNDDRLTLVARLDNLGKGASGAAIQNMNIALGLDETTGLVLDGGAQ